MSVWSEARPEPIEEIRRLLPEIQQITSPEARTAVEQIWERCWAESEWPELASVPKNSSSDRATEHVPDAWTLVTHARTVTQLALASAEVLERLHGIRYDRDALIVIALLHDVSKLVEYVQESEGGGARKGQLGELIQHGVYGAFLMWQHALPLEWVHAVISHTPSSAVLPQTQEALIVRYVDFLDTDTMLLDLGEPLHLS